MWEVEAIKGKKGNKYFVKWVGYPESDNTWEPLENLRNIMSMVDEFEE